MARRVVVTGLGPVSSIGIGAEAFAEALRAGRSGISPIRSFDTTGFPYIMAGEVHDFAPEAILRRLRPAEWGRTSQFAAAAARLAVADAGLSDTELPADRTGASMGTTGGESQVLERLTADALEVDFGGVDPRLVRQVPSSRLAVAVNRELGVTGDAVTLSTACSASNYALGYAYDLIRTGEADYMIAGGADSVGRWSHAGFYRLGALAEKACRPFDRDRAGILTGEGGAAMFLETLDSARARGAHIYAEVLGYGLNCDASHMVAPDPVSIGECMRLAHRNAGIKPADVDYICAHGTGTQANDMVEAMAVVDVFGDEPPPISSIKSMLGHAMGAASGFSGIASALGIDQSFLPPTINFTTLDPDLPLIDPVPNIARSAKVDVAQVNGFAFGGNNAITILGTGFMTITGTDVAPDLATTTLAVTGWGVLAPAGLGADEFAASLAGARPAPAEVGAMFPEPLPRGEAHALVDFAVRDHLGRKGTSFLDRSTSLALVACKMALADSDLIVNDQTRARIGVVLGTTAGSAKSTSDYSRETFVQSRPFLVNPLIFPNAVMNCAAGQAGIWFGLKGVNATIAGGALAALNVLRYARVVIGCGYADALLAGAVEEFSPHSAWATHFAMSAGGGDTPNGEGAAVLVLEGAAAVRRAGRTADAEILAVETGLFAPPGQEPDLSDGLARCIRRALERSGIAPDDLWAVASAENGIVALDEAEDRAIRSVVGDGPQRIRIKELTGECHSASSVFQLAALLGRHRGEAALGGRPALVTARSADGAAGAAVVRGWSRVGGRDR